MIKDGDWTLFDFDPATGRSIWRLEHDGMITFRTDYPVENLIAQNAEALSATEGKKFGDWNRIASVPLNILHDSGLSEAIDNHDDKFVARFLNDSDNRAWRTSRGRV